MSGLLSAVHPWVVRHQVRLALHLVVLPRPPCGSALHKAGLHVRGKPKRLALTVLLLLLLLH